MVKATNQGKIVVWKLALRPPVVALTLHRYMYTLIFYINLVK